MTKHKKYTHGMCMLCRACGCCTEKERVIEALEKEDDKLREVLRKVVLLMEDAAIVQPMTDQLVLDIARKALDGSA